MDEEVDQYSLDSDNELTEEEKKILAKVRQTRVEQNFDSEDEVLGFGSGDEDEEEDMDVGGEDEDDEDDDDVHDLMGSDIEGLENDPDIPKDNAWGSKKKTYYSTDYVDPDYSSLSEKQKAIAKMEEEEARKIQKKLVEELDSADFGLDMIIGKKEEDDEEEKATVQVDLSKLGKRQKLDLLKKENPEFLLLVNDFKDRLIETNEIVKPFLDFVKSKECEDHETINFIKTKHQLLRKYFINISFYLMLKAKRLPTNSHPVIKRLAEYRFWLTKFDEKQGMLYDEIKSILEAHKQGEPIYKVGDEKIDCSVKSVLKSGKRHMKKVKTK